LSYFVSRSFKKIKCAASSAEVMEAFGGYDTSLIVANVNAV
jgi:hypothetical protein